MKILIIALLLASSVASAQITKVNYKEIPIGKAKRAFSDIAWLSKGVIGSDTTYSLKYVNGQYSTLTDIQSIRFKGDSTLAELYGALIEAMGKEKGTKTPLILGTTTVMLETDKQLGVRMVTLFGPFGYVWLNEKEVKKLFGK